MIYFYIGFSLLVACNIIYLIDLLQEPLKPAVSSENMDRQPTKEELVKDHKMGHMELMTILEAKRTIQDLKEGKLT